MRIRKISSLITLSIAAPVAAFAINVGGLDPTRVNYSGADLETGYYTSIRDELALRGDTIQTIGTLTSTALSGVDVFYTGLLKVGLNGKLSASEQTSVFNWVNAGGTLFLAGDITGWQAMYNTWLAPFGISMNGDATPLTGTMTVTDFSNPIISGPNGTVSAFNAATMGTYAPGSYNTLATDDNAAPVLIQKSFGSGQVVAIGDHNLFVGSNIDANAKALFLNILDSSSAAKSPTQSVPDSGSTLLIFGLGFTAIIGLRRRLNR